MTRRVMQNEARQLLHNKFVVVLGDSVQRTVYKDLVLLLQRDQHLTLPQLKSKGEFSFEQDVLVEGGRFSPMNNGTGYREVRQYRSDHHLLRFYFLTRIYSPYMESILEDFRQGLKPDVLVISSCVWDISRYGLEPLEQYKENLHKFFGQIKTIVYADCLILWNLAMPLGTKIKGGFLVPEVSHLAPTLRDDVIEANFYSSQLAESYGSDVLDLHFHFRFSLQHRMPDGVHWDALVHRRISSLLLHHIADAWGVDLPNPPSNPGGDAAVNIRPTLVPTQLTNHPAQTAGRHYGAIHPPMHYPRQLPRSRQQNSAGAGLLQRPPPPLHRFPPPGNWRPSRQYFHPLPPDFRPWQQGYHQARPTCPQMNPVFRAGGGFRFPPHFHDDGFMRWRWRTAFRTHPYPPPLPRVTPRHPRYGW